MSTLHAGPDTPNDNVDLNLAEPGINRWLKECCVSPWSTSGSGVGWKAVKVDLLITPRSSRRCYFAVIKTLLWIKKIRNLAACFCEKQPIFAQCASGNKCMTHLRWAIGVGGRGGGWGSQTVSCQGLERVDGPASVSWFSWGGVRVSQLMELKKMGGCWISQLA